MLEPYRDYRGVEVIGAWRWLPAYDLGVLAEIAADEAFAPLRYLSISSQCDRRIRGVVAGGRA